MRPGIEIKNRSDRPDDRNTEALTIRLDPRFLLRRGHANPQHVGLGVVDESDHPSILIFTPGPKRRRMYTAQCERRKFVPKTFHNEIEYSLRGSEEKDSPLPTLLQRI